jgi:Co/Zn/Cd efflux system component
MKMACSSCAADEQPSNNDPIWRRALWIALAINVGMFAIEIVAGVAGHSHALQADALDFLGDAANYAISLGVAGLALVWRAKAALLKGATLALLGAYILASTLWAVWHGIMPRAETMAAIGFAALVANGAVALMLFRFRTGDANMRSVWICSRNDAIGNAAVIAAAFGVFGTRTMWPDLAVAAIMAALGLWGGAQIIHQAWRELQGTKQAPTVVRQSIASAVE